MTRGNHTTAVLSRADLRDAVLKMTVAFMMDIIIVEDGRIDRERLTELCTGAGYTVSSCQSVREAELALAAETFRLAILDIGLGDRSGSHLFDTIRRGKRAEFILIYTGNPSIHLKQRFLEEGAFDYIVKATPEAAAEALIERIGELLGSSGAVVGPAGMSLEEFLKGFVTQSSRPLFLDADGGYPPCCGCGAKSYLVKFNHIPQMPPEVSGQVVCATCGQQMDPEIG